MASSAVLLGVIGVGLTFFPQEVLTYLNMAASKPLLLILQLTGGLYFGFAMLNWMSQWSLIGGIYNKPVSVANFAQFFIGGMALMKDVTTNPELPGAFSAVTIIYIIYAAIFGWLFYSQPKSKDTEK